jgi:peptidyl-prolyl cis-trans isomerase C
MIGRRMPRRPFRAVVLLLSSCGFACEARDPVILELDGGQVRRSEFLAYLEATQARGEGALAAEARRGLLDAFVEERALVIEARARGLLSGSPAPEEEARAVARLLAREVKPPEVSEQEIRDYYGRSPQEFERKVQVSLRQVLVPTLNQARDVKRRLARDPKSFEAIARKQSQGPEADQGGLMGSFEPGQLPPELEAVAFTLPEGATSDPVQTALGYHVLRVESRQEARTLSFEEARDAIQQELGRRRRAEAERAFVAGVLARSKVNHEAALRTPRS